MRIIKQLAAKLSRTPLARFFRNIWGRLALAVISVLVVVSLLPRLIDGIITESLGIIFILLVVDYWRKEQARKDYQNSLKRQVRSRNNNTALDAIDIIRDEKWLNGERAGVKLLEGVSLKHADLQKADLSDASLRDTQFDNAILNEADLRKADLTGATFIGATLCGTNFIGAILVGTDFSHAHITRCEFRQKDEPDGKHAKFIESGTPRGPKFDKATLGCEINEMESNEGERVYLDLSDLVLNGASFKDAKLHYVRFDRAWLESCNFQRVEVSNVSFKDARLKNARFNSETDYQLSGISFEGACLQHAVMNNTTFNNVDFTKADMRNANCRNTEFSGHETSFKKSNLTNIIFQGASFIECEFDDETVFFGEENKTLRKHWYEFLEQNWLINADENIARTDDNEHKINEEFKNYISLIIADAGIAVFKVHIRLPVYEMRDDEKTGELTLQRIANESQRVTINYTSYSTLDKPRSGPSDSKITDR